MDNEALNEDGLLIFSPDTDFDWRVYRGSRWSAVLIPESRRKEFEFSKLSDVVKDACPRIVFYTEIT